MKAIALVPGTTNVQLIDWPEPKIEQPNQVKVKILEVGICGTDREEVAGGRADAPKGEHELIIGHEMFGQVVETGKGVHHVKTGDHVVITVRRGCGICQPCRLGCYDLCETGLYTERGIKQRHGYQAEFVVDDMKYVIKVPRSLKQLAVLTEPTTVVEKAIDHLCRIQTARLPVEPDAEKWLHGKKVLIAGLGPIGLLAAMVLRLRGAIVSGLDIVDPASLRPQLLSAMGGTYIQSAPNCLEQVDPFDAIIEAAGIPKLDFQLFDKLGFNGIYVLTGVPADGPPLSVEGSKIMKQLVLKNQVLFGSVNAGHEHFERAVADLEEARVKWPMQIERLITSRTPHEEFQKVLQNRNRDEIKAVITW